MNNRRKSKIDFQLKKQSQAEGIKLTGRAFITLCFALYRYGLNFFSINFVIKTPFPRLYNKVQTNEVKPERISKDIVCLPRYYP